MLRTREELPVSRMLKKKQTKFNIIKYEVISMEKITLILHVN